MVDIQREKAPRRYALKSAAAATLLIAGAVGFCHLKPAAPRVAARSLYIGTVRSGRMVVEVRAAGTLVAENTAWIPAPADGRVERILVQPGTAVTGDTVVMELVSAELAQAAADALLQVRAAEAELRSLRTDLRSEILTQEAVVAAARAQDEEARHRARADGELARAGLLSDLTYQASKGREQQLTVKAAVEQQRLELAREREVTDLSAAQSRLDQLRAAAALRRDQLGALRVKAGRDGVLQQIVADAGARVNAGANLARVAALEPLEAVLQISQLDAAPVSVGQRARIDTHQGTIDGVVSRIDPSVQNGSVTVDVRLPRELPRGARPDLSVDAAIEIDRIERCLHVDRPVHATPGAAVSVFRLAPDGRSARRVPVRFGRTSYDAVEIVSGLAAGDRVILSDTSAFDRFDEITITE